VTKENILSIFIDESGDLGNFIPNSPYYIVSFVFHEQKNNIKSQVKILDDFLTENNLEYQAIHTAPLIRREKNYKHYDISLRSKIFKKLFNFTKNIDITYKSITIDKQQYKTKHLILRALSKELSLFLSKNIEYFNSFDDVIVYYDDGQDELSEILTIIFGGVLHNFEHRHISPVDYKLFQSADLICTLTLLSNKLNENKNLTNSEKIFFGSKGKLRKNYLKTFEKFAFENAYKKLFNK